MAEREETEQRRVVRALGAAAEDTLGALASLCVLYEVSERQSEVSASACSTVRYPCVDMRVWAVAKQ